MARPFTPPPPPLLMARPLRGELLLFLRTSLREGVYRKKLLVTDMSANRGVNPLSSTKMSLKGEKDAECSET